MKDDLKHESSKDGSEVDHTLAVGFGLVLGLAAAAVGLYITAFHDLPWRESPAAWGQFGDFLGGLLNPSIAAVALLVLLASYGLQRRELKETRNLLQIQAEEMRNSNKATEQQRYETTFFLLLRTWRDTAASISYTQTHGQSAIENINNDIWNYVSHNRGQGFPGLLDLGAQDRQVEVNEVFSGYQNELDNYLRQLEHLIEFAETRLLEPMFYVQIVATQLSPSEIQLLAYFGCSGKGAKMNKHIEDHALLAYVSEPMKDVLLTKSLYTSSAFGKSN
jgi:hypothetical protein